MHSDLRSLSCSRGRHKRGVSFLDAAGDVEAVADRLREAEKEAAALRQLLGAERGRIVKEVRGLRHGWEAADTRARGFEHQTLLLRCAEATLTREVAHADQLTDWWRHQEASGRARAEKLQSELKAAQHAAGQLELDMKR